MVNCLHADIILYNGFVVTMDEGKRIYEAIALKDGKIIALGENQIIKEYSGPTTEEINLEGKTVLPGFIDAHQHIFNTGFNLLNINCDFPSATELIDAIKQRAKESHPDEWIIGWGYNESNFIHDDPLDKHSFDGIDNPVFISRYCLHTAVVNERALQLANISEDTHVEGGIIEKDTYGKLTGVLKEKAMDLVKEVMPPHTEESLTEMLLCSNKEYIQNGITSAHEAGLGFFSNSMDEFKVLQKLYSEKK